ncbi:MAG: acyltransferase [Opitutaceae bacterium]|nr:acyltransferase [Cytophagales bacterium]
MDKRIDFIDYTRGVAAILVLASHALEIFIPNWADTFQYFNIGQVGVVAFFMVSGYIIPYSLDRSGSIPKFIWGRISRIYPLYIFIGLVFLMAFISGFYVPVGDPNHGRLKIFFLHLFFVQDLPYGDKGMINFVPGNWTLFIEWIWYGLFVALFYLKSHKKIKSVFVGYNVFLFILICTSYFGGYRLPYGRFCLIGIALTGYLFYTFHNSGISKKNFWKFLLSSFAVLSLALYITFGYFHNDTFSLTCVLLSWTSGILLFMFFESFQITNSSLSSLLSYLGKISYSVYLVHPIVLYSINYYLKDLNPIFTISLSFLLSILVSAITFQLVERPTLKYLRSKF